MMRLFKSALGTVRVALYVPFALAFALCGLYGLRVFEWFAKLLAIASIASSQNRFLPTQMEIVFLGAQALLLTLCFGPLAILAVHRWMRWFWPICALLLFFCGFQSAQSRAYRQLSAAVPKADPHANHCPMFSASGLTYLLSHLLFLPPELLIDVNNEQCTTIKLAHDTELGFETDWEVFKNKAYNPRFIYAHYTQNALFPIGVAVARSIKKMGGGASDRMMMSVDLIQALSFVREHQDQKIRGAIENAVRDSSNPLTPMIAKLCHWEEAQLRGE